RPSRSYERAAPQRLELLPLLRELTVHLAMELDFRREARCADRVREIFAANSNVVIPGIHHELSTARVLVVERVRGIKITEKAQLEAAGLDPAEVVQDLMAAYVRMILAAGFFPGAPPPRQPQTHPARKLIPRALGPRRGAPDGYGRALFELMFSMMTQNESAMIRAFQELGFETKSGDTSTFLLITRRMLARSETGAFEGEFTEEMTDELFEAIRQDPVVKVPSDFVLVGRVFSFLSGIAHTLGSRANVLAAMGAGPAGQGTGWQKWTS